MKKYTFLLICFLPVFSKAQTSTSLKDGHTIVNYTDKNGKPQWHYAAGCERMKVMQMEASIFCEMCREKRKKETELKKQQEEEERQKKILRQKEEQHKNIQEKTDYWGSSSNTNSAATSTSSTNKPSQSASYSSSTKTNTNTSANSTAYQGVGKYKSSGPAIIYPVGPGTKRADGNYDVVDKYGKTHIIDPKANEKLVIKQRDAEASQRMANQQQKLQEQFKQQQEARAKQQEQNRQREAQINALANQASDAIYQMGTGIANMINESKAKKERERQRQLEIKQREEALKLKLEQERLFRIDVRGNVFSGYKDSPFPISTSKIPYEKLYYFIYAYDAANIDKEGLEVYISEKPFEITKYSDGTWPYKKSVADKIAGLTPYNEIITGYYPTEEEAAGALAFFKDALAKSNVFFKYINYQQSKKTSVQSTMNNFWKKEADTSARDSTSTKAKDKYWK